MESVETASLDKPGAEAAAESFDHAAAPRTVELRHDESLAIAGASVKVVYGAVRLTGVCEQGEMVVGSDEPAVCVPQGSVARSIGQTRIELVDGTCPSLLTRLRMRFRRRRGR